MWSKIQVFCPSVAKRLLTEEVAPQLETASYICSPGIPTGTSSACYNDCICSACSDKNSGKMVETGQR